VRPAVGTLIAQRRVARRLTLSASPTHRPLERSTPAGLGASPVHLRAGETRSTLGAAGIANLIDLKARMPCGFEGWCTRERRRLEAWVSVS
jgi:hypothetical protein